MSTLVRAVLAAALLVGVSACTGDPQPPASGGTGGAEMVIAVAAEPASLNPLAGYAPLGAAKIFEGLVEHQPGGTLRPALAAAVPRPSADGRSWTVTLRRGVAFSDGTEFDAADVVATYKALLDPAFSAQARGRFWMLTSVTQIDPVTVRFDLVRPYAPFPELLTLGILPGEALRTPAPLTGDAVRADPPPGTGPYRLAEWKRGESLTLTANATHHAGAPAITGVTVRFVPDDEKRAALVRDGAVDGAELPARQAEALREPDGYTLVRHRAADVRTLVPPTTPPADPAVVLALNLAVDRAALVTSALPGAAVPVSTPMPPVLAEFVEPDAVFPHDPARAAAALDAAGWVAGPDGVRVRDGVRAGFSVRYLPGDAVARDLVAGITKAAAAIGVEITAEPGQLTASSGWIARLGDPVDPDQALFGVLRSGPGATVRNEAVDAALDTGRAATDPAARAIAYRGLQRAWVSAPTMVALVAADHVYFVRDAFSGHVDVVDGPVADHTWGAWWNLERWTR